MVDNFLAFLSKYSDLINFASLLISFLTLVTMLRFRRRIRLEFDKQHFISEKKRIIKELDGYEGSLFDGLYTKEFLGKIDLMLNEIASSYACLAFGTKVYIWRTNLFLTRTCFKEVARGSNISSHELCKRLRRITIMLKKEIA